MSARDRDPARPVSRPEGRPREGRWLSRVSAASVALLLLTVATVDRPTASLWPDARYCLAVGAHVDQPGNGAGEPGLPLFMAATEVLGPLTVRRSFDARLPTSFSRSGGAHDPAAGLRSFVSWKPPDNDVVGAARGRYDEEVAAWARSVPRTGVYATAFHEPENDMTAEQFVELQRHLYRVVKRANPTIRWGPVYMAYWWDPAQPDHYVGDPDAWWPGDGFADFAGVDWYGSEPTPMSTSPDFLSWYRFARATGEPIVVAEYGQYVVPMDEEPDAAMLRRRAEAIRVDAAWIREHPRIRMWLYWHDLGHGGDWRLTDDLSQRAWRRVALSGCRP